MRKPMTKAAKRRHIRDAGINECPYCKADLQEYAEYGELDPVECGGVEQKAHCMICGQWWIDVFRLIDVREIIGPDGK